MSLYADYVREREGLEIYEDEGGFATFIIQGPECYIVDIYVRPEYRQSNHASNMADLITERARGLGCNYLKGSVDPTTNGATTSLKVLLGYGFRLWKIEGPLILFVKEI